MEKIKKLCANFLWLGKKNNGFHLAKWNLLTKSKSLGGWGLKDIKTFSKALVAKSLWRCCIQDSRIWVKIVRAKYLKNYSAYEWICMTDNNIKSYSNIWKAFSKARSIIKKKTGWKVDNGNQIKFDQDIWLNVSTFKISLNLYISLLQREIYKLEDCINKDSQKWKTIRDLYLNGSVGEWKETLTLFMRNSITLYSNNDIPQRDFNKWAGLVTTKLAYESIEKKEVLLLAMNFKKIIWFHNCPLKQRLFFWLTLHNKILIEDNLRKRGYLGSSRCVLCKTELESVRHLFIFFSFSRSIWCQLLKHLNLQGSWNGNFIEEAVEDWIDQQGKEFISILVRVWWGIWLHKNKTIIEDAQINVQEVLYKIEASIKEQQNAIIKRPKINE